MSEYTMGAVEMRFAEIIWEHEPVSSGELVKLCEQELNWKKSTTYTVLRRLCQKGIFISENGVVTSLLSKQMFQARQSEEIIEESFAGSLPDFVAAFTSRKKLSKKLEVPPYVIFQDPSLEAMATIYPVTLDELQKVPERRNAMVKSSVN